MFQLVDCLEYQQKVKSVFWDIYMKYSLGSFQIPLYALIPCVYEIVCRIQLDICVILNYTNCFYLCPVHVMIV